MIDITRYTPPFSVLCIGEQEDTRLVNTKHYYVKDSQGRLVRAYNTSSKARDKAATLNIQADLERNLRERLG